MKAWSRFLLRYVLVGIAATAALTFLCPMLDVSGVEPPPAVARILSGLGANPRVQSATKAVKNGFDWKYRPKPSRRGATASRETSAALESVRSWFMRDSADAEPPAPAMERAAVQMWGVVVRAGTAANNQAGKIVQELKPGTVVDIKELWQTKSGQAALCQAVTETSTLDNVLVRLRDLDWQHGPLVKVSFREKELRCQMAACQAKRDDLRGRRAAQAGPRADNPYYAVFTAAQTAHSNFWAKVKAMEARFDAAAGEEREQCLDDLKRVKISKEDVRVGKALEAAQMKYEEWNATNAATATDDDRAMAELNLQITTLRAQIEALPRPP